MLRIAGTLEGSAQILPRTAHGQGSGADTAAEIEGKDLGRGVAAELQRHQRQHHGFAGTGRAGHQRMADIGDME